MTALDEARAKATATYDAAADFYDDAANSFWDRFGRRTVERIGLRPGQRVLDVCCGAGASALPAAEAVGPGGSVLGIDLSQGLLAIARRKAARAGLKNVEFRSGDMLNLDAPSASVDAVVCVFGLFFVPDMAAALRELWRVVRPGGQLAITTWGPDFFEPGSTAFWDAVRAVAPGLHKRFNPWDRICDPASLRALFAQAGIASVDALAEAGQHAIASPQDWWTAVLGSGYRGTYEALDAPARDQVRAENLRFMRENDVRAVQANVVYAIAAKPA
jgi:ubiquinone/menaquinone biosynthesis C-methylase UbiE